MRKRIDVKNKRGRIAAAAFLLFAAFLVWQAGSTLLADAMGLYGNLRQIRMNEHALLPQTMEEIQKTRALQKDLEQPDYTAWTQKNSVRVENTELGHSIEMNMLYYFGANSLLFDLQLENGCAIPYEKAFDLWGTDEVLGETVRVDGREYIVEKIIYDSRLYGDQNLGVAKADPKDESLSFDVFDVRLKGERAEEEASVIPYSFEEVTMGYQLNSSLNLDYSTLMAGNGTLRAIPVWLTALAVTGCLCYHAYRSWTKRNQKKDAAGLVLCAVAVLLGCNALCGFQFEIPQSFVPTRWSDFEFWSTAFSGAKESLQLVTNMQYYGPDAAFRALFIRTILCGIVTAVLLFTAGMLARAPIKRMLKTVDKWQLRSRADHHPYISVQSDSEQSTEN